MEGSSIKVSEWIDEVRSRFHVSLERHDEKQQFARWKVQIQDPNNVGQPFCVYFDEDKATILEMGNFHFGWFNVAEGYTSKDILDAALKILEGTFEVEAGTMLRRPQVCFQTSRGPICGKAAAGGFVEAQGYTKKRQA